MKGHKVLSVCGAFSEMTTLRSSLIVLQYDWDASLSGMLQLFVVPKLMPGLSESPYMAAAWPASATYA